ncbi:MAG TPA: LamG-like jellyroll fold domain-containing protein, partial [Ardenticatenaceae bacterium]
MNTRSGLSRLPWWLLVIVLITTVAWPVLTTAAPVTDAQHLQQVWRAANDSGQYDYDSAVRQTTRTTPQLENVGRPDHIEHVAVQGKVDRLAETMTLRLEQGSDGSQRSIEMKVEQGTAFGRLTPDAEWTEVEGQVDLFAPGGDPLGYLAAVENVRILAATEAGEEGFLYQELLPEASTEGMTRYRFDLNGVRYAEFMRERMEGQLRQKGELPAGVNLDLVRAYVEMEGTGELWVGPDGLPLRQSVHLRFPPESGATEWVEADITTTFGEWGAISGLSLLREPGRLLREPASLFVLSAGTTRRLTVGLSSILAVIASVLLLVQHRQSRRLYAAFAAAMVLSILGGPLMQTQQASAFYDRVATQRASREEAQAVQQESASATAPQSNYHPRVDPLAVNGVPVRAPRSAALQGSCDVSETEGDCDGDGLNNGAETYKLGTSPVEVDSDNDQISDRLEVEGDSGWYLNPLDPDSNGDGLPDGLECPQRADYVTGVLDASYPTSTCNNNDDDTTPDAFDFDNDGDGVPDTVDSAPYDVMGSPSTGLADDTLNFNLALSGAAVPVFVNLELRPTQDDHLWQTNNVLDWPDHDTQGQITRVHDSTFASYDPATYGDNSKMANGDILLSPMLEVQITFDPENPSAGLPITPTMSSAAITDYSDLSWLDTDALEEMGIAVNEGETSDTLYLYAPLQLLEDSTGDTPVAWSTTMLYRPEAAQETLGNDQKMRVVWLAQALTDACDTTGIGTASYSEWCADESHWTTSLNVIQSYYEDFYVTGVNVREDHGGTVAIVAQPNNVGSTKYQDRLLHLARNLETTLIQARTEADGSRFAVSDISGYLSTWGVSGLNVTAFTLDDQTDLLDIASAQTTNILNRVYPSSATGKTAQLLFAGEETARTIALGSGAAMESGNRLTMDLGHALAGLTTNASLRWAPYVYEGASVWDSDDVSSRYTAWGTALQSSFTNSVLNSLSSGETISDYTDARDGAVLLAQNAWLTLYAGLGSTVAMDGTALGSATVAEAGNLSLGSSGAAALLVADLLAKMQDYYGERSIVTTLSDDSALAAANSMASVFAGSASVLLEALGSAAQGEASSTLTLALQTLGDYYKTTSVSSSGFLAAGSITALAAASIITTQGDGASAAYIIVKAAVAYWGITWGMTVLRGANVAAAQAAIAAYQAGQAGAVTTAAKLAWNSVAVWAVIAFVVSVTVIWVSFALGSYENSLQREAAKAYAIAATIVATIYLVISLIPVVGAVIMAVIAILDILMIAICKIVDATQGVERGSDFDVWYCSGFTGILTRTIMYLIFDQMPVVDLEDKDRVDIALQTPTINQRTSSGGFVKGNSLTMRATVTNTLSINSPTGIGSALYNFFSPAQVLNHLRDSTFRYTLQQTETDQHAGLAQETVAWDDDNRAAFQVSGSALLFSKQGINQSFPMYLTESWNMDALECWGFIVQECDWKEYKDSAHIDLSENMVFDVLPATLDGFIDLGLNAPASYRLSWSDGFPTLQDADGDGLRSASFGGGDPDDSLWDSDGDGLSDYYELENGTDASSHDGDRDGLGDYWELFYDTSPFLADSDGDGLEDGEEVFHSGKSHPYASDSSTWTGGWSIVYDYDAANQPLSTWVSADPTDYDSDDDTILDKQEYIYGYNPAVASTLNILSLDTQAASDYVAPGGALGYTATVRNELDNRLLQGLLEAEFPVDVAQQTQILGNMRPQTSASIVGSVTAPGVAATEAMSLTLRAGVEVSTDALKRVLWLPLNEPTGSTTFNDYAPYSHPFSCTTNCPVANGQNLQFSAGKQLSAAASSDFQQESFSVAIWVNPTEGHNNGHIFGQGSDFYIRYRYYDSNTDSLVVHMDNFARLYVDTVFNEGQWNHLVVTYDAPSQTLTVYMNGTNVGSASNVPPITYGNFPLSMGASDAPFVGAIDDVQMWNEALSETEVLDIYNQPAFHATFEEGDCGDWVDRITGESFTCASNYSGGAGPVPVVGKSGWGANLRGGKMYVRPSWVTNELSVADSSNAFAVATWLRPQPASCGTDSITTEELFSLTNHSTTPKTITVRLEQFSSWPSDCKGMYNLIITDGSSSYSAPITLTTGWHHLALSYDGSGTLKIHLDGRYYGNLSAILPTMQRLLYVTLGASPTSPTSPASFEGYVDDFRLYTGTLADDAVRQLYRDTLKVLELPLDEAPGASLFEDRNPNGYHGFCTIGSCPDSGLPGRDNQSLRFGEDGAQQSIRLPVSTSDLSMTSSSFTVMAWVKGDAFANGSYPVLGTTGGLLLGVSGGKPYMDFGNGYTLTGSTTLQADTWYHIAWHYDNSMQQQAIYVNGVLEASRGALALTDASTLYVGKSGSSSYFKGMLDNLVISSDSLSASEIQTIMNDAPVLNLHLDEDLNSGTFVDSSSYQNNATCSGSACPTAGSKGQMREAPVWDGNDVLTAPYHSALNQSEFAISAWVLPERTSSSEQWLFSRTGTSGTGINYGLYLQPNSQKLGFRCITTGGSTRSTTFGTTSTLQLSQWNHVVLTRYVDTYNIFSSDVLSLYVNGVLQEKITTSSTTCNLSAGSVLVGQSFTGQLDEVAFYGSDLDAGQVSTLYDYQAAWYDVVAPYKIVVDADDPLVEVKLTSGTVLAGGSRYIAIAANDPSQTQVAQVQVTVTPPSGSAYAGSATLDGDTWLYSFTPTGDGSYTVQATATDSVGNSASDSRTIQIDSVAPTATLDTSLTSTPLQVVSEVTLSGTVSDGGIVSSGVATETVAVQLLDAQGGQVSGYASATSDGSVWSVAYPLGPNPYGAYSVVLSVQDEVGNAITDTLGTVALDSLAPTGDLMVGSSGTLGSDDIFVPGSVTDVPYPLQSKLVHFRFEEEASATTFVDAYRNHHEATCSGSACPVAGASGQQGRALTFDGGDSLAVAGDERLDASAFSVSLWLKPSAATRASRTLLRKGSAASPDFALGLAANSQKVTLDVAPASCGTPTRLTSIGALTTNAWSHIAVSYDGDEMRLYINGVLDSVLDTSSTGLCVGTSRTLAVGSGFVGSLDELVLFDSALDEAIFYDLAHPLAVGVASAQVRFRQESGETTEWSQLALSDNDEFATWSLTPPDNLEGAYKIDLEAADTVGNSTVIRDVWSGEVDTLAPRIALTMAHIGSGAEAFTEIHFSVDDRLLESDALNYSCANDLLTTRTYPGDETLILGMDGVCREAGHRSAPFTLDACDALGNCDSATVSSAATPTRDTVAILAPENGTNFDTRNPITLSGGAFSPDGLDTLVATVNGQVVYTETWASGTTWAGWSTTWTPSAWGSYSLGAELTSRLGAVVTDTLAPSITVIGPDLSLTKTVTPDDELFNGDAIAYTLVLSNAGPGTAANVRVTDLLPTGVLGSDLDTTINLPPYSQRNWTIRGTVSGVTWRDVTNTAYYTHTTRSDSASATFAQCGTLLVTNDGDSGEGSLREAVGHACDGTRITFAGDYTITLSTPVDIQHSLTLDGTGRAIVLDGADTTRLVTVAAGKTVTLEALTLQDGSATAGGAILNAGTLTLQDINISSIAAGGAISNTGTLAMQGGSLMENRGTTGGALANSGQATLTGVQILDNSASSDGGALWNRGTLTVTGSEINGNEASGNGGAIANTSGATVSLTASMVQENKAATDGGALWNEGTLSASTSTLSGNSTSAGAGAIAQRGGTLTLNHVTVAENSGTTAGGLHASAGSTLHLSDTILANNGGQQCVNGGTLATGARNIITSHSGCGTPLSSADPLLGTLGDYGGATMTYPLLPGSPAINQGIGTCQSSYRDQRGLGGVSSCDIGAFESQGFTLTITGGNHQSTFINSAFAAPLSLTVTPTNAVEPVEGGAVTFHGSWSYLASLEPRTFTVPVGAGGAASRAVSANGYVGSYTVSADAAGNHAGASYSLNNVVTDLTISKSASSANIAPGAPITYTITFANAGGGTSSDVQIADTLPVALGSVAFTANRPVTPTAGNPYLWALGDLAPGASGTITVTGVASSSAAFGTSLANTVTIDGGNVEPTTSNNNATASARLCYPHTRLYVDASAPDGGTGSSWADAFNHLQDALTLAGNCGYAAEIWVAGGSYYPDEGRGQSDGSSSSTFTLPAGVKVYGGFAGNETSLSERDWTANPTILSGDIAQDDLTEATGVVGDTANHLGTNSLHVVSAASATSASRLDGFTITAGHAMGSGVAADGGGMTQPGYATLANLAFTGNYAADAGGALNSYGGGPTLRDITFTGNSGRTGGALHVEQSQMTADGLSFLDNEASYAGPAVYVYDIGLAQFPRSTLTLTNALVSGNRSSGNFGAVTVAGGTLAMTNATLAGNYNGSWGDYGVVSVVMGGMRFGSATLANVILWGNSSTSADLFAYQGTISIRDSIVPGVCASYSGITCTNVTDHNPLLAEVPSPSSAPTLVGDLRLLPGSAAIDAGSATGAPAEDIRGVARPAGSGVDIGAYEAQGWALGVAGGDGQSSELGSAFALPLGVTLTPVGDDPVAGGIVTFTAPESGASLDAATLTASSDATGVARTSVQANSIGGSYVVTATTTGGTNSALFTLTNSAFPDLALSKSATPATVAAGETITYVLSFRNQGPTIASGVVLTDWMPGDLTVTGSELFADSGVT